MAIVPHSRSDYHPPLNGRDIIIQTRTLPTVCCCHYVCNGFFSAFFAKFGDFGPKFMRCAPKLHHGCELLSAYRALYQCERLFPDHPLATYFRYLIRYHGAPCNIALRGASLHNIDNPCQLFSHSLCRITARKARYCV